MRRNGASEAKDESFTNDLIKRIENKHRLKQSIFSPALAYSVGLVECPRKPCHVMRSCHDI